MGREPNYLRYEFPKIGLGKENHAKTKARHQYRSRGNLKECAAAIIYRFAATLAGSVLRH